MIWRLLTTLAAWGIVPVQLSQLNYLVAVVESQRHTPVNREQRRRQKP